MMKLAVFAAVAVVLLACDTGNPVAPIEPGTPGTPPSGGAGLATCEGLVTVPETEFLTEARASRRADAAGAMETLRVEIGLRVTPQGKKSLSAGSSTDEAIITVAYEPNEPVTVSLSTNLGYFVDRRVRAGAAAPLPSCSLGLETVRTARRCRDLLASEDASECRVERLAFKPGDLTGEARILVELEGLTLAPDAIVISEGGERDEDP